MILNKKRGNNDIRISIRKQFIACFRSSETDRDCKDNDEMEPLEEKEEEEEEEEEESEAWTQGFMETRSC